MKEKSEVSDMVTSALQVQEAFQRSLALMFAGCHHARCIYQVFDNVVQPFASRTTCRQSRCTVFFCSRNCCLCAVHQSVKELRRAKEQREIRQHQKKPKTSKKAKTKQPNHTQNPHKTKQKHQKHHNHARPFAASETGETGETRSAQDR